MNDDRTPSNNGLSDAGQARREAILGLLHARLDARVRNRRRVRAGVAAAAMIALLAAMWAALPGAHSADTHRPDAPIVRRTPAPDAVTAPTPADPASGIAAGARGQATVRIAATPPLNAAPCEASAATNVCLLNDEQLLAALAEAGQPSGLIRIGDRAIVVPQSGREGNGLN